MPDLLKDPVLEYGDRAAFEGGLILRCTVGSGLHGIAIPGTDDHDEMAIFIEPPSWALGIERSAEHYVARTQPEGARSGPGDTDLVAYTLRKYLRLATKGNPTALLPLFAPVPELLTTSELGDELRELGPKFLSREAADRFLGFMRSQRNRLVSARDVPNRPELVERYGYDVKYASHALRLAMQGREITLHGRLSLPMPPAERERVLEVKRGEVRDLNVVLAEIDSVAGEVQSALDAGNTPLPQSPDLDAITAWSIDAHRRHWGWRLK
ncbi:MAG TPA: nucleotidyltransferase domain-containing protein [Kineosporiaceae bacterium]|nr:nucleotidyltransferase domain-containing protein [Kineosporiaceae bacterium]